MDPATIFDSDLYTWVLIPLLIFAARVFDVSLGTLRFIFVTRGQRYLAPVVGFFEVIIWLLAIGQIMQNLDNVLCYIAYGAGFAAGTFVGMWIENRLSIGLVAVRIITRFDAARLISYLRNEEGYGVTVVDAQGRDKKTKLIFTIIKRQDLKDVGRIIRKFNPHAFYSIEDIREVSEGRFPRTRSRWKLYLRRRIRPHRKGK